MQNALGMQVLGGAQHLPQVVLHLRFRVGGPGGARGGGLGSVHGSGGAGPQPFLWAWEERLPALLSSPLGLIGGDGARRCVGRCELVTLRPSSPRRV